MLGLHLLYAVVPVRYPSNFNLVPSIRLACNAIAITIHFRPISGFSFVKRSYPGCSSIIATGPMVARLRPFSYEATGRSCIVNGDRPF